jgi:hypothetical protein
MVQRSYRRELRSDSRLATTYHWVVEKSRDAEKEKQHALYSHRHLIETTGLVGRADIC